MKLFVRLILFFSLTMALALPVFSAPAPEAGIQLIYCLSSHDTIAQNQMDDFVVDYMLAQDGGLRVSLFEDKVEGVALHVWTLERKGNKPTSFNWDGKLKKKLIEPGSYILRFVTRGQIEETVDVAFEVTQPEEPLPLAVTQPEEYLPLSSNAEDVWQAMMSPIAVVDTGDLSHEPLYESPSGKKIGTVHGQTAGLIILELNADGFAKVGAWATEDGSYIEGYMKQDHLKMVKANPRFGLLIDKVEQTMQVYEADESSELGARLLGTLDISTGLMAKNKLFRETRAGAFITQKRIASFTNEGYRYDYAIRIDGGNLIHEMGHKLIDGSKDFSGQMPELGSKASHGCVRVRPTADDKGLNAQWLWKNLPRNTKVLVLDDPQARMQRLEEIGQMPPLASTAQPLIIDRQEDSLSQPVEAAAPQAAPEEVAIQEPLLGRTRLSMTFCGDCILGSEEKSRKKPESFDSFIAEKGYEWPFSGVYDILSQDDLSIINLEGILKDDTRGKQEGKLHWFRGPTEFVNILPAGSIEMAGLANNHMRDYGIAGHNSTRQTLEAAAIPYFGYGDTYIHEHQGIKIGFGGIRETTWRQKSKLPGEEIAAMKAAGCDYIVYTIHAGKEYSREHNELQTKIAHAIIDAGADLIIGMHPHVVQGIEEYNGGLIVYSLGNFSFGGNLELREFDGLMVQLQLDFHERALKETTLRLIPVLTTGTKPANDFRPVPAEGKDKERILSLVQADSPGLKVEEVMRFSR